MAVVDATAPPAAAAIPGTSGNPPRHGRGGHIGAAGSDAGGGAPPGVLSGQGAPSPVTSILSAAVGRGGGGMGILLPALMLAAVLGVIARAGVRWRRARAS